MTKRFYASLALTALALAGCGTGPAVGKSALTQSPGSGSRFVCTPVKVWDGDGPIHCAEGPKVRLAGIATREVRWTGSDMVDAGCNEGHPCPTVSGVEAREHLGNLLVGNVVVQFANEPSGHIRLTGPKLACTSNGSAGGSRTAAWCASPVHGDLSCRMVRDGFALRWAKFWRERRC
jgi:endonuclease YncB( thermonuclease family)